MGYAISLSVVVLTGAEKFFVYSSESENEKRIHRGTHLGIENQNFDQVIYRYSTTAIPFCWIILEVVVGPN